MNNISFRISLVHKLSFFVPYGTKYNIFLKKMSTQRWGKIYTWEVIFMLLAMFFPTGEVLDTLFKIVRATLL